MNDLRNQHQIESILRVDLHRPYARHAHRMHSESACKYFRTVNKKAAPPSLILLLSICPTQRFCKTSSTG